MNENILNKLQELKQLTILQAKEALDMDDICVITGLSKAYIYTLVCKKQIPFYKSKGGGRTYFKKSEINDWMLAHKYNSIDETEEQEKEKRKMTKKEKAAEAANNENAANVNISVELQHNPKKKVIRDSFVFYRSFYEAVKLLPLDLYKEILDAMFSYALDGELSELSPIANVVFKLFKPQIDANNRKFDLKNEQRNKTTHT